MTFLQALVYFFRQALSNLARSWKISLLAVLTIAVSVFLGGVFLLVGNNLRYLADQWRQESRLMIYLASEADADDVAEVRRVVQEKVAPEDVVLVEPAQAEQRFRAAFPNLADLLEGWGDQPLPASLEVTADLSTRPETELKPWLDRLRAHAAVQMVDDDREWLGKLGAVILVVEGVAAMIGLILIVTAVFTISSVIRLTAYLYQDEIAVMRLVGATEFYIRGPFYAEGLIQGLTGGALAVLSLLTGHHLMFRDSETPSVFADILAKTFLSTTELLLLVLLGGTAGLVGAVLSLRKETLGQTAETEWVRSES